jgi:hypothetical protein
MESENPAKERARTEFAQQIFYGRFAGNERIENLTGRDVRELFECMWKILIPEPVQPSEEGGQNDE